MKSLRFTQTLLPLALAVATTVAFPMVGHAQTVRVNWSKKAAFSDYKTFQWVPSKNSNHPFYRQDVGHYLTQELQKKHLKQVSANPDLIVTYHYLTQEMMDAQTTGFGNGGFGDGFGYGYGDWGGWGMGDGMGGMSQSTTTEVPVTMGILTIDMIDAKTKKIIWRGQASTDNVNKSTKGEQNEVKKAIDKMLGHFPPK